MNSWLIHNSWRIHGYYTLLELNSLQNFIKTRVDAWGTQSDCVELVQVEHVDKHVDVQICPEDLKSFED